MPSKPDVRPLSDEGRALAERYRRLALFVLRRHFVEHRADRQLWRHLKDVALNATLIAASRYNPRRVALLKRHGQPVLRNGKPVRVRVKFHTYAYRTIWGTLKNALRYRHKLHNTFVMRQFSESQTDTQVVDRNSRDPLDELVGRDLRAVFARRLALLTERDRFIVERRYGLNGHHPHEWPEIAALLGIKPQACRQRFNNCLPELRALLGKYLFA